MPFTGVRSILKYTFSLAFSYSLSSHPDQPTEQRRFPVHLSRKGICGLPLCSHCSPSSCDELHRLKLMHPKTRSAPLRGVFSTHKPSITTVGFHSATFIQHCFIRPLHFKSILQSCCFSVKEKISVKVDVGCFVTILESLFMNESRIYFFFTFFLIWKQICCAVVLGVFSVISTVFPVCHLVFLSHRCNPLVIRQTFVLSPGLHHIAFALSQTCCWISALRLVAKASKVNFSLCLCYRLEWIHCSSAVSYYICSHPSHNNLQIIIVFFSKVRICRHSLFCTEKK